MRLCMRAALAASVAIVASCVVDTDDPVHERNRATMRSAIANVNAVELLAKLRAKHTKLVPVPSLDDCDLGRDKSRIRRETALPTGNAVELVAVEGPSRPDGDRRPDSAEIISVQASAPLIGGDEATVTLARNISEPFEVKRTPGLSVRSRLQAADAYGGVADDYLVYPDALGPGAHVLHRGMPNGTEDFISFDVRPAASSVTYDVELGADIKGLRLVANTLELLDGNGNPVLRVAPPIVIDADAVSHDARLSVLGCAFDASPRPPWGRPVTPAGAPECRVRIDWDNGITYPALVDPSWVTTGSMATSRSYHTANVLPNGDILVAGGIGGGATAEIYSTSARTWSSTSSMSMPRSSHSSNDLPDGQVLVLGGYATDPASAETYDLMTGTWSATGPMPSARAGHASIALGDGRVLATGGINPNNSHSYDALTAFYDPVSRAWTAGPLMIGARAMHTLTPLNDGRIIAVGGSVAGGTALSSCEVYDPMMNSWAATGALPGARYSHVAARLASGLVLVAGGYGGGQFLASATTYDPALGAWTSRPAMAQARSNAAATVVPSGSVLVAGGHTANTFWSSTEFFDPSTMSWAAGPTMANRRANYQMTLFDGVIAAVGGRQESNVSIASTELTDMNPAPSGAGASTRPWNDPTPPAGPPPRTRLLNNPPSFTTNPCYPTASCPTTDVGPFLDWTMASVPSEHVLIGTLLGRQRTNSAVVNGFCNVANAMRQQNWERALMALTLLGSMRSPLAQGCLTTFANLPLPTTGTYVSEGLSPDDVPAQAVSLAILEAVAVDGLALIGTSSADGQVRQLAANHPSVVVRSEAIRAYIADKGAAGRAQLIPLVRPEEQAFLDGFENRVSASTFDSQLETYLSQHPEDVYVP